MVLVLKLWPISNTAFALPLETVPARLSMINSGSVKMTKVCQHRAKPSHAVLAQLTLIKRAGTEPAQLGTFSPAGVNDIESNPCCSRAVPSTELVHFSPKNTWQRYHNYVAAFHVFVPSYAFLLPTEEETINRLPWWINIKWCMHYQTSCPLNQKLT